MLMLEFFLIELNNFIKAISYTKKINFPLLLVNWLFLKIILQLIKRKNGLQINIQEEEFI